MFVEIQGDIFDNIKPNEFLVHCISADAKLGAGIAKQIKEKYDLSSLTDMNLKIGKAYYIGNVINLVTKQHFYDKPTYTNLRNALKDLLIEEPCNLIMPRIGCGLDKLEWSKVRKIIKEELKNINVRVFYL